MWSNGSRKDFLSSYKWLRAGTEDGNWVFLSASCCPHAKPALRLTARRLPGRQPYFSLCLGGQRKFVLLPFTCCVLPFICTQTDSYNNPWGAEVGGRVDRKSSVMKKEQRALESDRPVRFEPARGLALGVHLLQFIEP